MRCGRDSPCMWVEEASEHGKDADLSAHRGERQSRIKLQRRSTV
ncbi:MAG: hypothetical protein QOD93_1503 [Acetobacteraceae bacterium]|jgi:hypothetical protein|nr:hypothetical protein [Acetobacteraceae bacterium]